MSPTPCCGELPGFLREENIDQPQPFIARFGPAIGKRAPALASLRSLTLRILRERLLNRCS